MSWVTWGFNPGGEIIFTHMQAGPGGPPNHLYGPESPCWEVNGLGCDINHPLPSSTDVIVREELYPCFTLGTSWPVLV
jgi:hypothetical protein